MRVLYYVPQLGMGGTERLLAMLLRRLDTSCFEPLVWCPGPWGPIGDELLQAGIPVHRVPLNPSSPRSMDQSVCWLRTLQALIFHSFGAGWEWFDTLLAKLAGIPVCFTARHNMRYWDPGGKVHLLNHIRNIGTDAVIANARAVAELWAGIEDLPPEKVRVVYTGVEKAAAPVADGFRDSIGIAPEALLVGNIANPKPVKGQSHLLHAFRDVVKRFPQARLVICGHGKSRPDLERLRDHLGLREHVHFLGLRLDVDRIYAALDAYVHSSLSEGFSCAVLEAMASGLPVVATAVGGTPEAVVDGVTGFLTPPSDPTSLAQALLRLLQDEPLRRRMGAAGRERVETRFTVERMVREYEAVYREHAARVVGAAGYPRSSAL